MFVKKAKRENIVNEYFGFLRMLTEQLYGIENDGPGNYGITKENVSEYKKIFLNGVCEVLRRDLFYDHVFKCIKNGKGSKIQTIYPFDNLPYKTCEYNLKNTCIFMNYSKPHSLASELGLLRSGHNLKGSTCWLYKNIGLGFTGGDGNHRIIAAAMENADYVTSVNVIDDSEYLKTLTTDGCYWYDDTKIKPVSDVRIALLFSIQKYKNNALVMHNTYKSNFFA